MQTALSSRATCIFGISEVTGWTVQLDVVARREGDKLGYGKDLRFREEAIMKHLNTFSVATFISLTAMLALAQVTRSVGGPPPNAWMKTQTRVSDTDSVPPAIRLLRDQFFDSIIGSREVLTAENATPHAISEGSFLGVPPEILELTDRAVLIGTFNSFRSVLSASGHAIYTEASIRVAEMFEDASGGAHTGADITIGLPGGTVSTQDGKTISYLTQPRGFFIQPGKTYLFVLEYHASAGGLYIIGNDWDLSDGVVRANSGLDLRRQKEGTSSLIGLTRAQLVQSLNKRFQVNQ
jgi:hypothetical protein